MSEKRKRLREWRLHRTGIVGDGPWGVCTSGHESACLCWYALPEAKRIRPVVLVREVRPAKVKRGR